MAKKVFTDYYMADEERLKGYTVANVAFGTNAADSGMLIELEREVDNVVLGIDIFYDPDNEELEEPCQISQEYVKRIYQLPEEPEKKVCQCGNGKCHTECKG
ncbi:hypothetical protein C806_02999 [Lachnospiraceae bacterium 3-1]|nr:hypothetical protein C806_02999 [Lachnospiraceae bacterium 3-1]